MPFPPDGIGLYSKDSAASHLHVSQAESGPTVMRAALLPLVQACVEFERRTGPRTFLIQFISRRHGMAKLCALSRCINTEM